MHLLWLCIFLSPVQNFLSVCTNNVTVYASEGDTVILKCKVFPNSKSTWDKVNKYQHVIPYADGKELDTGLPNIQNLAIVGNRKEGDYNLKIQHASSNDKGLYVCSQISKEQGIHEVYVTLKITAKIQEVLVRTGDTIILNCTCISQINGNWVGPNRSSSKINSFNEEKLIPYTEGFRVNKKLNISNINVVGRYENRTCNLVIKEISIDDEDSHTTSPLVVTSSGCKNHERDSSHKSDNNYDEIGTLNYNNAIFDHIANDTEMNNDNVSNIIESNDIILRANVASSDNSSSIKQSDDGYENPYQAINPCDIDMHHYSSIVSCNYQNTIICPPSLSTNTSKYLNIAMDSLKSPWLVIYKRK
ncbi:unnamed protein product [Mytilus coruscus]|uniref:Ig-like domain-containing protein n=1 Tax=Mytilus coruscus TaxID=42192 RepID=A0A6J8CCG3_MYTCO|nr:unnamed protein product [Mytilus coruscus]